MVYILLGAGFEEAEALVTADVLRRANIPVALTGIGGGVGGGEDEDQVALAGGFQELGEDLGGAGGDDAGAAEGDIQGGEFPLEVFPRGLEKIMIPGLVSDADDFCSHDCVMTSKG